MRDNNDLGNPTSPTPGSNRASGIKQFKQILTRQVRAIRWECGLDGWERAVQTDADRAMELVLAEMDDFTDVEQLEAWLLLRARRAVEEGIVAQIKCSARSLEHDYCRKVLDEGITQYIAHYWLSSAPGRQEGKESLKDKLLKNKLLKGAERAMEARLADYTGKLPLHRWIKQLAHRADVERGNIHSLRDWLDLIARMTVERHVVAVMLRNPESPQMRLNMIWVAQHVAPYFKTRCGEPASPWMSNKDLWAVLMDPEKKPDLHEKICGCTNQVVKRIIKGLPTFKFESMFDTWRTTILRHTMSDLLKSMTPDPDRPKTLTFTQLARKDGREFEESELALADDGSSVQERAEIGERRAFLKKVIELTKAEMPDSAEMIDLICQGYKPREIAAILGVPAAKVSGVKFAFIKRALQIWHELDGDDFV